MPRSRLEASEPFYAIDDRFRFQFANFREQNIAAVVSQAPSPLIAPQGAAHRIGFRGNTG
jgi:hypothetical protein